MKNILVVILLSMSIGDGYETRSRTAALSSLVQTERLFARTCGEKGIRASFLEFFAGDAIAFIPEPVKYKDAVKGLPAPDPHAVSLEWEPQVGEVAASCDLGYTTGPSVRTDNTVPGKPRHYGVFFSAWKKQKDGTWKVAVDIGVSTPGQSTPLGMPFSEPERKPVAVHAGKIPSMGRHATLMSLDTELSNSCSSLGLLDGYLSRVDDESRLYRKNTMPIIGVDSIRSYLRKGTATPTWKPVAGEMSLAGDLGYSYGSYEYTSTSGNQSPVEKGYYLHVWKRTVVDEWKIVADVTNPVEPEAKK